jgi:low temperature requirement protein LtrA
VGAVWGAMLVAMAAMFVAALAVPDAFGLHGVAFGLAFLIVNAMHLTLYALAARGDRDLLTAILRIALVPRRRGSDRGRPGLRRAAADK